MDIYPNAYSEIIGFTKNIMHYFEKSSYIINTNLENIKNIIVYNRFKNENELYNRSRLIYLNILRNGFCANSYGNN